MMTYREPMESAAGEALGARVRRLRRARGWTQRELAGARYDRGFLAKVETGARPASDELLGYLAGRFGLTADELRYGRPSGVAERLEAELTSADTALARGETSDVEAAFTTVRYAAAAYRLTALECRAWFCLGELRWQNSDLAGVADCLGHARLLAEAAPPWLRAVIVNRQSGLAYHRGDTGSAVALIETALTALRATPDVDPDAELALLSAVIHPLVETGGLRRARRAVQTGELVAARATRPDFIARFHRQAGQLWQAVGEPDRADAALAEALRLFTGLGFTRDAARCRWARGFMLRRMGRLDQARQELTEARDGLAAAGSPEGVLGATIELADVRRRQGAPDEAETLVDAVGPLLARSGQVETRAEVTRLRGLIARARGDLDVAAALLAEAAAAQERAGLRGALASTSLHLGDTLRALGWVADAASAYRRGVRAAADLDHRPGDRNPYESRYVSDPGDETLGIQGFAGLS